MLYPQSAAGEYESGIAAARQADGNPGWDHSQAAGRQGDGGVDTCPQIQAGGAFRGSLRHLCPGSHFFYF